MSETNGKITKGEPFDERTVSPEMSLISVPERGISIEKELAEIEKNVEFFNRVKIIALKMTKSSDWVDLGGNPYLMDRGSENVAVAFGVDISDLQLRQEWAEDEKGRYYTYVASGKAYSKKLGRYVEDIGVCSQRDKFFGKVGDKFKEVSEVDMANVRRKAVTNLYNSLIKRVIGLRGVTFADLEQAGIKREQLGKVEYKGGAQRAEISDEGKDIRTKLGNMLLLMGGNDKDEARKLLEKYSSWKDNEQKLHSANDLSKMSEKWIKSTYGKVKADYEKMAGAPPEGEREPGQEG